IQLLAGGLINNLERSITYLLLQLWLRGLLLALGFILSYYVLREQNEVLSIWIIHHRILE
ncbi:MAG: hypothetical protein LBG48_03160, partial [Rickettsiales bacterium]|nr:hypothetical protein [Rickettsiales bacterium]